MSTTSKWPTTMKGAGILSEAVEHLGEAGEKALEISALQEAVDLFSRAIDLKGEESEDAIAASLLYGRSRAGARNCTIPKR